MYCPNCGSQVQASASFCMGCGNALQPRQPSQQFQQQQYYQQPLPMYIPSDIPSGGIKALCFFFPIVGLILYLVKKDTEPISAKAYGKFALIGFICQIVFSIFYVIILIAVFDDAFGTAWRSGRYYY